MEQGNYSYDVFLSYRHKPLDAEITQKVFHMLESYQMPPSLKAKGHQGIRRAFRDTEELAVSRILSSTIEEALHATNCLVVVCSPDTPSSEWVDREVATFIELGRAEKVFPLLIAGDPESSFPPSLKKIPDIMNRVMDVRAEGDAPKKILALADTALLPVIAEVSGCHRSDLLRQHKLRKLQKSVARRGGAAVLFALVFLGTALLWAAAENYRAAAQREQDASMAVLEELTYDLPDRLVELPGTYGAVTDILSENAAQIIRILGLAEDKDSVNIEIAANYEKLATAYLRLGNFDEAMANGEAAIRIYEALPQGKNETRALLASAWSNTGVALHEMADYTGAAEAYDKALAYQEALLARDNSAKARQNMALFAGNIGANEIARGDYRSAADALEEAYALLQTLEAAQPGTQERAISAVAQNLGSCHSSMGDYAAAERYFLESAAAAERVFDRAPNRSHLLLRSEAHMSLGSCYMLQAKFDEALHYLDLAVEAQELLAGDKENAALQSALAVAYNNYGLCLNMRGDYAAAEEWYLKNAAQLELVRALSDTPLAQASLARAYYNVAENAYKKGDYVLSRAYYDQCLALYGPVSTALGDYHRAEYLARLAYYQIIFSGDYSAALNNATAAWDLQPDSSFVLYNFAYALLFNNMTEESDAVFRALAARSAGEVTNVRLDFEAMTDAGLYHPHMPEVLAMME